MTAPSKRKGNRFENEVVSMAKDHGFTAKRAYASDGRSLGYGPEVDVVVDGIPIQCKRRKRIASWLKPFGDARVVAVREDRGETYIIVPYETWLKERKHLQGVSHDQGMG